MPEIYPYRVRAWWGEKLVADSDACLCVDRPGEPTLLFFPPSSIDLTAFGDVEASTVELGEVEQRRAGPDGGAVLTLISEPVAALAPLVGYGRFSDEQLRLEVVDDAPDDDPRDVTCKRFPPWGDARHLIDLLDVRPIGDRTFMSEARSDGVRPVVEGSQMLGQAIVAAARHLPGRRVASSNMLFLRVADAREPLTFEIDELSAGRSLSGLSIRVLQHERCCAAGMLLMDATADDLVRHECAPPSVAGPYDSPSFDMSVTGRDVRFVDGAYGDFDALPGPPLIDCWVRFRHVPDEQAIHAALLAQFTGHLPIAAALRPHAGIDQSQAHRSLSMGINAINLSLHRDVRADEWMLYHHESTFAGDGMTHAACRVHNEAGELLASFSVEAMVRSFPAGREPHDERTAL